MINYVTNLNEINSEQLNGFFVGWMKPISKDRHYRILENSSYFVLAIDSTTKLVVGFINALSDGLNFAFIPMLEVLPEYQKQGIGSTLMNKMLDLLDPISCIDLSCDENMQSFYEQFNMIKSHGMVIRKH
ncbi:GNAT family N-acetyltransferase [Haloplasma contractile]|uniref:Phospholipiddiacylglycerol acyltransferase protein n=1 Tax=Haloplasma contractile SSD-17B TaxID=1033810 RepID=F7Q0H8_9MOLU|nr:GNAT family N-acetyltransferase [Haloplasma contractile]ERJ12676.1 phospholipiddiacylglycerol acyltransferase protein [Haloplasma contractile SSD-17B]